MDRLRDCLEEMLKFTLDYHDNFDLGLTGEFCSGLLSGESFLPAGERIELLFHALLKEIVARLYPFESNLLFSDAATVETFAVEGVPDYPLYKLLALGLLKSIDSASFCGTFEKISLVKEAFKDIACEIHVQEPLFSLMKDGIKTVEARCFEAEYDRLKRRGSMVLINKCLMFEVLEVHQFSSFYELLKAESPAKVFPGIQTVEEGMQMFRKLYDVDQEKINGVVAIHLTKSVVQPCVALAHILSGLSYIGVQSLLGLFQTTGSIFHALPPPRSILLSSFMLPYKPEIKGCRLSHGARALAKHVDRNSDGYWGVLHGTDSDKNRLAMDIINRFIGHCCWMNIHIVPPHREVFEIRVAQGYGARWTRDGAKFIGFLEPYTEDGHSMAWGH